MTDSEKTAAERPGGDGAAPPDRPRRRRRVRVIEVLDDEDLDEVLDAIEAEEEQDAEPAPRPVNGTKARPAEEDDEDAKGAKEGAGVKEDNGVKEDSGAKVVKDEDDEGDEEAGSDAEDTATTRKLARRAAASSASGDGAGTHGTFLGLARTQAVVVVLLVAVLATLAIWQWRSASAQSSTGDAREEVAKVASAYGDAALSYNASNYQEQMDKAQKLMGGDLLETFKTQTLPNLGSTFKDNPDVALTSKTNQVFVGSVDDRFATAVISVDITIRNKEQSTDQPATLLRLALSKIDGEWKVTRQYASGVNDQNRDGGTLGNVPGGTPSPSPSATSTGKDAKSGKDDKSGDGN
ncbi:hypothetical protein ABZ801_17335 [Actinomadura sp. NPDC047616]|uniref:hypothetical protein n=1 Tax=Actinomadura sp. NPDC047616 TaxID=3155914 RepID=UPI0033D2BCE1